MVDAPQRAARAQPRTVADFDVHAFAHVALWNPQREWIEMRLRATRAMRVRLPVLDMTVDLAAGEELGTEVSGKFRRAGLVAEFGRAGFDLTHWWTDPDERVALSCLLSAELLSKSGRRA